jgi:DNA-binding NarL/FixJ family response regulator
MLTELGQKKKILIVEDHPVARLGLTKVLAKENEFQIIGEAEDVQQAMDIIENIKPDIIILDLSLKSSNGLEFQKFLKTNRPDLNVLVVSMFDETIYAVRVLEAGAKGYLMKDAPVEDLLKAVHSVSNGRIYVSDNVKSKIMGNLSFRKTDENISSISSLSTREQQVFMMISRGWRTRQIAQQLGLSIKTIETYCSHIKDKLNLSNAAELLRYAVQWSIHDGTKTEKNQEVHV